MYIIHNDMLVKEKEKRKKNRDMKIEGENDDIKTNWEHFI